MAEAVLTQTRIRAGVWEGVLTGAATPPELALIHHGAAVPGLDLAPMPAGGEGFAVRVQIPIEVLSEGVQTFLIREPAEDRTLAQFTLVVGEALEGDLRAELALMRAELDLLKRAFRRHCVETAG